MPEVFADAHDDLGRTLLFVERWNRSIDSTPTRWPHLRYQRRRVEDISGDPAVLDEVVAFLSGERRGPATCAAALRRVGTSVGRRSQHAALTWADVRAHPNGAGLVQMALEYGYTPA